MSRIDDINFINNLRKRDFWCNAKIISSDGRAFCVHSAIMMTQSGFFRAVFQFGPNDGKKGSERARVYVPYVNGATLELVVDFVYTGELQIDKNNVWPLIRSADFLQMPLLLKISLNFLSENMTFPTCVQLLDYTETKIFFPSVRDTVTDFALKNICEPRVPLTVRQTSITKMSLETLEWLLSSKYLNAPHEEFVWEAIVAWINGRNSTDNAECLARLIKTIRFGYIRAQFIMQNILHHPLVMETPELVSLIKNREQELEDWLLADNPQEDPPETLEPRLPHTFILSVGGWIGSAPGCEIALYDPHANYWTRVQSMECPEQTQFAYHGLVRVGDWLYVIGGTEILPRIVPQDTARCVRFNLKSLSWEKRSDLQMQRNFVSCVELGGFIYAFGGRSNFHTRLNSVEVYDPEIDMWKFVTSMNARRSDAGYTVLDDKIYAVGGFSGDQVLQTAERYDPCSNTWEYIKEMSLNRSGLRCVAVRGHIFAIGGYTGRARLALVERYDPTCDSWLTVQPMNLPRSNLSATVWRDYIIVTGGYSGRHTVPTTEIYDIFEDQWYYLAPLPSPRSALNIICIEGEIELAEKLLREHKESASSAANRRDQIRPAFKLEITPFNIPLPEGRMEDSESETDDEATVWDAASLQVQNWFNNNTLEDIEENEEFGNAELSDDGVEDLDWEDDEDSLG